MAVSSWPWAREVRERPVGVGRVHRHLLDVLGDADRDRVGRVARLARGGLVLWPEAVLDEDARRSAAALPGDDLVAAVVHGDHDEVLQDAFGPQARDERREVGPNAADVGLRGERAC